VGTARVNMLQAWHKRPVGGQQATFGQQRLLCLRSALPLATAEWVDQAVSGGGVFANRFVARFQLYSCNAASYALLG
jgi:hypothetical protein